MKELNIKQMNEEKEKREMYIDKITDYLYDGYGSGTGVLFGIPSELKPSVRVIVKLVLEYQDKEEVLINTPTEIAKELEEA